MMKKTALFAAILMVVLACFALAHAEGGTCAHNYGAWKSANNAQHSRTCSLCNQTETASHDFTGETTTVATCMQKAVVTYKCAKCEYSYTVQLDYADHSYGAWQSDGKGNHTRVCTNAGCGKKETTACTSFTQVSTTPATCVKKATVTQKCGDCGYTVTSESGAVDLNAHTWAAWTTTVEGHTRYCTACSKPDPANGAHTWGTYAITKAATCSDNGEMSAACSVCAFKDVKTMALDPNNHSYTYNKIRSDEANHYAICNCGTATKAGEAHKWNEGTVTKTATCVAAGAKEYVCTTAGCGRTKTEVIPIDPNNHPGIKWSYNETVHTWTCPTCNGTGTGNHTMTGWKLTNTSKHANSCKDGCGYAVTQDHTWSEYKQTKEATCSQTGEKTRTCSVCAGVDKQTIKSPNHTYGKYTKYNELYHEKTCSVCKQVMRQQHKFEDVEIIREATATKEGQKTVKCSVCGYKTKQSIPLLGSQPTQEMTKKDYVHIGTAKLKAQGEKNIPYSDGSAIDILAAKASSVKAYAVDGDDAEDIVGLEITSGTDTVTVSPAAGAKTLDFVTLSKGTELIVKLRDGQGTLIIQNINNTSLIITQSKAGDQILTKVIQSAINNKKVISGSCLFFLDEKGEIKITFASATSVKIACVSGAKAQNQSEWKYTTNTKNINITAKNSDGTCKGVVYTLNVNDASVNVVKDQKKAAGKIAGTADDIFHVDVTFADDTGFSTPRYYLGGRVSDLEPDDLAISTPAVTGEDEKLWEGDAQTETPEEPTPEETPTETATPVSTPESDEVALENPWNNFDVLSEPTQTPAQNEENPRDIPDNAIGLNSEIMDTLEDPAGTINITFTGGRLFISVAPADGYTFQQTRVTQVIKGSSFSVNMLTSLQAEGVFDLTGSDSKFYAEIFLRDAKGATVSVKTDAYNLTTK